MDELPPSVAWTVVLNDPEDEATEAPLLTSSELTSMKASPPQSSKWTLCEPARIERRCRKGLLSVAQHTHMLAELLSATGFSTLGHLVVLQRSFSDLLKHDEIWRAASLTLAMQAQLYVPTSYALGWKRLFWDQLWPARSKWQSREVRGSDFQIRVGVRFRPLGSGSSNAAEPDLFLPLHQRLRLWRDGQISREELLETTAGVGLANALRAHGDLSTEMVEALLGAQHLKACTAQASAQVASVTVGEALAPLRNSETSSPEAPQTGNDGVVHGETGQGRGMDEAGSILSPGASVEHVNSVEDDVMVSVRDKENPKGRRGGSSRVLAVQPSRVTMYVPGQGVRNFAYGRVLDDSRLQNTVYAELGHDMICAMLNGFNACLFCYGQTGSGKTHTLYGPDGTLEGVQEGDPSLPANAGIVLRALHEVLEQARNLQRSQNLAVSITCQYVEIYNEQVSDLLSDRDVLIRGSESATLQGAAEVRVGTFGEALQMLKRGQERKHVAQTAMNDRSSRAHTVFVLNLTQVNQHLGATVRSTLHLVDLAGCEQLKTSGATGARQVETININSSLFVLGKVITALVEGHRHVPYQESTLTRLLRPALGGNSRTTAIVTGSLDDKHGDQTLHALRFGERCQRVINRAELEKVRSVSDALCTIDNALQTCQGALHSQEERGFGHLPLYQRLRERYLQLQQARSTLCRNPDA